jgi:isoleucyl-tRNA synthetase
VLEVIDAWYDSGSMPFAQWGYPHVEGSAQRFKAAYPAQFICEAIDQTRGWFYTLMAIGTLVFRQSAYENVLCLGHIVAEDGRKMSKHLGNILEPLPLMHRHGADGVRWFMLASGSPWAARRIGHNAIQEGVRKVLLTYWNTASFHVLYARTAGWTPGGPVPAVEERPVLDRWLVSATARLTHDVTVAMDTFDTQRAGQLIAQFVDDLSNWYVRRSRRRFWSGEASALGTLHDTLEVLTRLMAPLTPFITERVWQDVVRCVDDEAAESVHLSSWPVPDMSLPDDDLVVEVSLARRIVELGRSARAAADIRTRQPLRRALVATQAWESLRDEMRAEICDELNVARWSRCPLPAWSSSTTPRRATSARSASGSGRARPWSPPRSPRLTARRWRAPWQRPHGHTDRRRRGGRGVHRRCHRVRAAEEGWSVVNDQGETVALDVELTPELLRAGRAREVIRLVQEARKRSGFDVSDRIDLWWQADDETAEAIRAHADLISGEVLAISMEQDIRLRQPIRRARPIRTPTSG